MASGSTHFKLGLFALGAIAGVFAAAFTLGLRGSRSVTVTYHTYFDESVQGLKLGAPVDYRGVKIGSVAAIEIAPDHRHIDVSLAVAERDARRLGLATPAPGLRAYLATQGITGLKLVDLDFAGAAGGPPAALGFAPAQPSLPSGTSLLKRLEDRSDELGRDVIAIVKDATASLHRIDAVVDDVHGQRLPARVAGLADRAGAALDDLRRLIAHVDRAGLPARAAAALDGASEAIADLRRIGGRIDGDDGLLSTTRQSIEAVGDVGRGALGSTEELERTLRELGDAARAVRKLVDELERDPDMLVKGRAPARGR